MEFKILILNYGIILLFFPYVSYEKQHYNFIIVGNMFCLKTIYENNDKDRIVKILNIMFLIIFIII